MHTYKRDSAPLFIAKETQKNWKPQLDSFLIQKRNLKSGRIRLSVDWSVDRPKSRSTERSIALTREQSHVSRSTVRWPVVCCGRPGGRPLLPLHVGAHRSTGQSTGNYCRSFFVFGSDGSDGISLPTILHLGEDFANLSRSQHRICRLESGCINVAAYVPWPRDQAIRSSSKWAPTSSCDRKDMDQCFTVCKFYFWHHLGKHIGGILLCVNVY